MCIVFKNHKIPLTVQEKYNSYTKEMSMHCIKHESQPGNSKKNEEFDIMDIKNNNEDLLGLPTW